MIKWWAYTSKSQNYNRNYNSHRSSNRWKENNIQVLFKNCAPFTDCISEVSNTQIDNAKDIDVVMPMYNLIEYGDNYSKISGS